MNLTILMMTILTKKGFISSNPGSSVSHARLPPSFFNSEVLQKENFPIKQDKGEKIECVRDIDYIDIDYEGNPIDAVVLKVFVDSKLYYMITRDELDKIMKDLLSYFKVSVEKHRT